MSKYNDCYNDSCALMGSLRLPNPAYRKAPILALMESPNSYEASSGILGNRAIQLLLDTMLKAGFENVQADVNIVYAISCYRPKKGKAITKTIIEACRTRVVNIIAQVEPRLIICCGKTAYMSLMQDYNVKITEKYGQLNSYNGIDVFTIMHPSIHDAKQYKPFLQMIENAAKHYYKRDIYDAGMTDYRVCRTQADIDSSFKFLIDYSNEHVKLFGEVPVFGYDIETTSKYYRYGKFLNMGISFEKNKVIVIPKEFVSEIGRFLINTPWLKCWHHGKYDKNVLWQSEGIDASIDHDTIYLHSLLDETSPHDLGFLSTTYLQAGAYKYKMNQQFVFVTTETYPKYAESLHERVAVDADYTLQLYHILNKLLKSHPKLYSLYQEHIIPLANLLCYTEQEGMLVNSVYLKQLDDEFTAEIAHQLATIKELAIPFFDPDSYMEATGAKSCSDTFNPASSSQMAYLVHDVLKLNPRIKKGRSTDKKVIDSIENPPKVITAVKTFRRYAKEHSTYVQGLLKARWIEKDSRVRTTFNQHISATGRLTSKNPNVQNQSGGNSIKNVRRAFIPKKGFVFGEIDFAGAELRWLAAMSKCPILTDVFVSKRNLHKETAITLFGENFNGAQKLRAKAVNFGIPYGREAKSLADEFNIPVAEAQVWLDGWLNKYWGARDYLNWCAEQVSLGRYLETPYGRRRRFGLVTGCTLHELMNEAKNFPIQSVSSDTTMTCARLAAKTLKSQFNTTMINYVHDSIVMEIPNDWDTIVAVGRYMRELMTTYPKKRFDVDIPFEVDYEIGYSWSDTGWVDTINGILYNNDDKEKVLDFSQWWPKEELNRVYEYISKEVK